MDCLNSREYAKTASGHGDSHIILAETWPVQACSREPDGHWFHPGAIRASAKVTVLKNINMKVLQAITPATIHWKSNSIVQSRRLICVDTNKATVKPWPTSMNMVKGISAYKLSALSVHEHCDTYLALGLCSTIGRHTWTHLIISRNSTLKRVGKYERRAITHSQWQ
jgi:hypothetical protein